MSSVSHDHDVELTPATWKDGKRYAWLLGLLVPTLPFIAYGLVQATGLGIFWFFGPFLVFGIFPIADLVVGMDARNPPDSVIKWLEQDRYYRWCTYLYIPIQYAGLVFACVQWSSGNLSVLDSIGLALTMAMVSGIAINTAHELGHKRASLERWLSKVALAQSGYGHFFIEHNRGHHVRVATPEDPASSRLGESFWAFLPRTVKGSLTSAWELECVRLDRLGARHVSVKNDIVNAWLMTVVLFAALTAIFGWVVLPYLLLQAVVGFSLLEVVNYLEHYGLLRQRRDEDGRYERTRPEHSWNPQQRRLQRAALPPPAPQRPPRQPDAPLPGAAPHGRRAAAADGLRRHDRAGDRPAAVAARGGPPPAGALRRGRRRARTSSRASVTRC